MASGDGSQNKGGDRGEFIDALVARIQAGDRSGVEQLIRRLPVTQRSDPAGMDAVPATEALDAQAAPPSEPGGAAAHPELGDFELSREIGRGGMGVVYEARQVSLNKRVALKILPLVGSLDNRSLTRFKNEAQAAAQLEHPGIVPVLAVGVDRGVHYYAMQYIDGLNLAQLISQLKAVGKQQAADTSKIGGDPTPRAGRTPAGAVEAASSPGFLAALSGSRASTAAEFTEFFLATAVQIADALHYAHSMGVVHRDIKPSNLIVDSTGHTWLTDFGLAQVQGSPGVTVTGNIVGTLRYMSPEQAYAKRVVVDHRTDIYSLGVTLYELLTLQPAVVGEDRAEILRQVAFQDPTPPRRIDRRISPELETVLLKSISKNPDERYQTAAELADDLRRLENDEPIRARPPTVAQRVTKWARRHKSAAAAILAVLAVLFVSAEVSTYFLWQANLEVVSAKEEVERQRDEASEARDAARLAAEEEKRLKEEARAQLRKSEGLRLIANSSLQVAHNPGLALALAVHGAELHPSLEANNALLAALEDLHEVRTFFGHGGPVGHASFSPDGELVVSTSSSRRFLDEGSEPARIWNVATGEEVGLLDDGTRITSAVFSPDGTRVLTASSPPQRNASDDREGSAPGIRTATGNPPVVWDWLSGRPTTLNGGFLFQAHEKAFDPEGRFVVTPTYGHNAVIWNAADGREHRRLEGHSRRVVHAAFDDTGKRVVTISDDNTVRIWDVESETVVVLDWWARQTPEADRAVVRSVDFGPDGRYLASAAGGLGVHRWSCDTGEQVGPAVGTGFYARYNATGDRLVVEKSPFVEIYDAGTMQLMRTAETGFSTRVRLHPILDQFVSWRGAANTAQLWTMDAVPLGELRGHDATIDHLEFDASGKRIVTASNDGTTRVWNSESWGSQQIFPIDTRLIPEPIVCFQRDGPAVALATEPVTVTQAWRLDDREPRFAIRGRTSLPQHFGETILVADQNRVTLVDAAAGVELRRFNAGTRTISEAVSSPTGDLAIVIAEGAAWLWDLSNGQRRRIKALEPANSAAFNRDGALLAVATKEQTVRIFDVDSDMVTTELSQNALAVMARFTRVGDRLLTVTSNNCAYLWDPPATDPVATFRRLGYRFDRAVLSHDEKHVFTYRQRHATEVVQWEAATGKELNSISVDGRGLTRVKAHPSAGILGIASEGSGVLMWDFEADHLRRYDTAPSSALEFVAGGDQFISLHPKPPINPRIGSSGLAAKAYIRPALRKWETSSGKLLNELTMPDSAGNLLALSAIDETLYLGASSYGVTVYDPSTESKLASLPGHAAPLVHASMSPDGRRIATASWDQTAAIWDVDSGSRLHTLARHTAPISAATNSLDGELLATADVLGHVKVWNTATGAILHEFKGHSDAVLFLVFSPDNEQLLSGSLDETVRLASLPTGTSVVLPMPGETPRWAGFSDDGTRLLIVPDGRTEVVGDAFGVHIATSPMHPFCVRIYTTFDTSPHEIVSDSRFTGASFLPGSHLVLTVSAKAGVEVWDVEPGERVHNYGADRKVQTAFARGDEFIFVSRDRISVLNRESGKTRLAIESPASLVSALGFPANTANANWLLTVSDEKQSRKWPLNPLEEGVSRMPRSLTLAERRRLQVPVESTTWPP